MDGGWGQTVWFFNSYNNMVYTLKMQIFTLPIKFMQTMFLWVMYFLKVGDLTNQNLNLEVIFQK